MPWAGSSDPASRCLHGSQGCARTRGRRPGRAVPRGERLRRPRPQLAHAETGELDLVVARGARAGRRRGQDTPRRRLRAPVRGGRRSQARAAVAAGDGVDRGAPGGGAGSTAAARRGRTDRPRSRDGRPRASSRTCGDGRAHVGRRADRPRRRRWSRSKRTSRTRRPSSSIIGLPDKALGEAVQRVHNACANSGLTLPRRRLTVNLSPASLPKHGSGFDVAIAIASLATEGRWMPTPSRATVHIGRAGARRPAASRARRPSRRHRRGPRGHPPGRRAARERAEAELVEGIEVLGAVNLADVARWHGADVEERRRRSGRRARVRRAGARATPDLADVIGQREAVEALIAAAAGGHHLLMSGPPGAGKTMLASRLPGILPDARRRRGAEVASIRSLSGDPVTLARRGAAVRGAASQREHRGARRRRVARACGRARSRARATGCCSSTRRGSSQRARSTHCASPSRSGAITIHRAGVDGAVPRPVPAGAGDEPVPLRQLRGSRWRRCMCPPMAIRRYLGQALRPAAGPHRHRAGTRPGLGRARAELARVDGTTTGCRRGPGRARRGRARAHRLRERRGGSTPSVSGTWLREGPLRAAPVVRRPLDAALHRGALTLRGYDRVLRSRMDARGHRGPHQPHAHDIGRALFMKKGITP